jgi:hypothetical protein
MPEANKTDQLRAYLVILATVGVIAFNWMAAAGYVNGVTPQTISDKYPTLITPAGYAFSIWGLIYAGLAAFSIYQVLPSTLTRFRSARSPYILSCVLNCVWIYFWHHDLVAICLIVIVLLWLSLLWTYKAADPQATTSDTWLVKAPFGIYSGWVTAATLVNLAVALKSMNVEMSGSALVIFGVLLILIAAAVGVVARIAVRNFFFPLAVAWALAAIGVKQSGQTAVVIAATIGLIACLIASASFVLTLKGSHE